MSLETDNVIVERQRIRDEYRRRKSDVDSSLYGWWQPDVLFSCNERRRIAARMLHEADALPRAGQRCLEVGCGSLGWLGELTGWAVPEKELCGIDLDPLRIDDVRRVLPSADLRIGDATQLPWPDQSFRLVIASTVFTSVLDDGVRSLIANEIMRVMQPGGALLWYDFAVDNPRNPNVRRVTHRELRSLFSPLTGCVRTVTLAPPIARFVTPKSWLLATFLEAIPFLRTHLIAVLTKL